MKRTFQFTFFIAILALVLYGGNSVIYAALSAIFGILAPQQLILLATVLGVLSASLIIATIIGSYFYNWFTRIYYTIAAVWIGFFVYLFLTSIIYGLIVMFTGKLMSSVGEGLVLIALFVGIYGLINARKVTITEVPVSLAHLPDIWRGRKAVWISDLHLGQLRGERFAERAVEKVNMQSPDIVFIGGDLFDGTNAPDLNKLILPLRKLNPSLGTYFITGNHEEFGDNSKFLTSVKTDNIRILQDEMAEVDRVQIIGVDYHNASKKERFQNILSGLKIDANKPSILLKHEPKDMDVAEAAGVSLVISGHTHRAQLWPLEYIAKLIYKKFAYGLQKSGAMQAYTSSGVGTWGPPMRVGNNSEIVVFTFK